MAAPFDPQNNSNKSEGRQAQRGGEGGGAGVAVILLVGPERASGRMRLACAQYLMLELVGDGDELIERFAPAGLEAHVGMLLPIGLVLVQDATVCLVRGVILEGEDGSE
jgi:hypothetical protein